MFCIALCLLAGIHYGYFLFSRYPFTSEGLGLLAFGFATLECTNVLMVLALIRNRRQELKEAFFVMLVGWLLSILMMGYTVSYCQRGVHACPSLLMTI